jgi:tRNA G18 (ribose-2'-O)-methylase SpoU
MAVEVVEITDFADERLDVFARLTEAQLRCRLEPEKGVFIAESFKVIDRALAANMVPVSFLVTPKWLPETLERAEAACASGLAEGAVPVFVAPVEVLQQLTGFKLTRGALCAMRRPVLPTVEEVVRGARRVAVLEGIVDHTNVGAIFRSAAALNVDAVLVTPTCCDPLYRRAARVSMGTVFQVPWTRIGADYTQWPDPGLRVLNDLGFTTAAFALTDESLRLDDPKLTQVDRLAMVFGTEGDGLGRSTIAGCDLTVRIPMANGVDSLNVAAASAVAFWHLCEH